MTKRDERALRLDPKFWAKIKKVNVHVHIHKVFKEIPFAKRNHFVDNEATYGYLVLTIAV